MEPVDVMSLDVPGSTLTEKDLETVKEANKGARYWPKSPFPVNPDINKKVLLYDGDLSLLKAEAVVNSTNENLSNLDQIDKLAGPDLEDYIRKKVRMCATGDVRLTPGFRSNFKHIIHAVPPKYQPKYKTAAETALFHTYFRILETMIEKKIRTVLMPALTTMKSNLPVEDNCNLQLRTIRRMLEKKLDDFDKIVIHVPKHGEQYRLPFFCYFPRSAIDEEIACHKFTQTIGGPNGEPVIPEREIRIKSMPGSIDHDDRSVDLTSGLDLSTVVGKSQFSRMQDDLDKLRSSATIGTCPAHGSNGTSNGFGKGNKQQLLVPQRNIFRGCTLL